jgi:hypothetical protein
MERDKEERKQHAADFVYDYHPGIFSLVNTFRFTCEQHSEHKQKEDGKTE